MASLVDLILDFCTIDYSDAVKSAVQFLDPDILNPIEQQDERPEDWIHEKAYSSPIPDPIEKYTTLDQPLTYHYPGTRCTCILRCPAIDTLMRRKNIRLLQNDLAGRRIFSPMVPTTISVMCKLDFESTNVDLVIRRAKEYLQPHMQAMNILAVSCNKGFICSNTVEPSESEMNGHLKSQIRFQVQSATAENPKTHKIPLFTTGTLQNSGVIDTNLASAVEFTELIADAMQIILRRKEPIQVSSFRTIMQNYKWQLRLDGYIIDRIALRDALNEEGENRRYQQMMSAFTTPMAENFGLEENRFIRETKILSNVYRNNINTAHPMKFEPIIRVAFSTLKKLQIKFIRCRPPRKGKGEIPCGATTVLVYQDKVNLQAAGNVEEAMEIWIWLQKFIIETPGILLKMSEIPNVDLIKDSFPPAETAELA